MKKLYIFFILFLLTTASFAEYLNITFNVPKGKILFNNIEKKDILSASFFDGELQLELERGEYSFIFTAEGYPLVRKNIKIEDSQQDLNIIFTRENSSIVKGKVTSNGLNLGSTHVSFTNSENISYNFISNILGEFTAYLPKGKYKITAERIGYSLNKKNSIIYDFTNTTLPYNIKLELDELPSSISGRAVDELGNSIPYPKFTFKNGNNFFSITGDEFGMFRTPVSSGIVTVIAQKPGYLQNGIVRKIENNSSITNIEIPLTREKYSISGIVTDGIKALKNVEVELRGEDLEKIASTTTDENGFYEFYKFPSNLKVFVGVSENKKLIKRSEVIDLNKNFTNFNLILN